jgi:hypothetical protein
VLIHIPGMDAAAGGCTKPNLGGMDTINLDPQISVKLLNLQQQEHQWELLLKRDIEHSMLLQSN